MYVRCSDRANAGSGVPGSSGYVRFGGDWAGSADGRKWPVASNPMKWIFLNGCVDLWAQHPRGVTLCCFDGEARENTRSG